MFELSAASYELADIKKYHDAGINTVLFALPFFSARPAGVFTNQQIEEGTKLLHELNMKSAVQLTRFFTESECEACRDELQLLKAMNVDQIYFTDCAVLQLADELAMKDKLIYNPDTLITNAADAQFYLDQGIHGVTLSKEITKEEMIGIAAQVKGNLEVLIHGRLNMMHSKRRLLTSYYEFLGREFDLENNHDLYLMEENREEHMPIIEDELGTHVFTGFTLCSFNEVNDLVKAGIQSLRIESLFMSSDEVAQTARDYRDVLEGRKSGLEMFEAYQKQYPNQNISTGFMYKKTSTVKVNV